MTTENGKELGGHHCPDWDGLWVTPSSPEHEACTCYIGSAMTTNKPEVVGWMIPDGSIYKRSVVAELARRTGERPEPLIRLSDYEALQAECEELRKDAELWESIHDEIHRRADKEHALADRCDFDVTIMYEDYAAIDAAMAGGDQ